MKEQPDPVWGKDFINDYITLADQESHNNPKLHLGFILALTGESLSECTFNSGTENCRIHSLIIQKSGSGKNAAFDVALRVANEVDRKLSGIKSFDFHDLDNITNGNLVGTIADREKKPGQAELHDILGFREVAPVFDRHTLRDRLRLVLDEETVTREMRDGTVELESTCTFVGTTPPERIDARKVSDLINEGTLARPLYFYKPISLEDSKQLSSEILTEFSADKERDTKISDEKKAEKFESIVATLVELNQYYQGGVDFEIAISEETLKKVVEENLRQRLEVCSDEVQILVQPLITRYTVHAIRISCILAALDECSERVTKEHLKQGINLWEASFDSMIQYFNNHGDGVKRANSAALKRQRDKAQKKLEMMKLVTKEPLISKQEIANKLKVSPETVRKYSHELNSDGILKIHGLGGNEIGYKAQIGEPVNESEKRIYRMTGKNS